LRELVLSGSKEMDWWVWQFKKKPAGYASIVVAEDKKSHKIIGHMCNLPLRMKVNDDVCRAVTSVDTMVHPNYRGLRIYGWLRENLDKVNQQKQFGYSWTGRNMFRINKRRGIKPVFKRIPFWIKPIKPDNIVTRYFKRDNILTGLALSVGKSIIKMTDRSRNYEIRTQVREVREIDERFDTLWQQASSHHKIMMVRDRAYLDWRYIKKPDADYTIYVSEDGDRLLGYIVLRIIQNNGLTVGWIVDILTNSKDSPAGMDLIGKAIQYYRMVDTDIIWCVMPPKAYFAPVLRKFGFLMISKLRRGKERINCRTFTTKYPDSFLHNPDNWYVTRGDSDLI
jgi:hypothetical protein